MKKIITLSAIFILLHYFSPAQDVTFSGSGCGGGAVSGTWTVPCGVSNVTIHVYGGGGGAGGGGGGSNGGFFNTRGGGGAGGGGYTTITINVTPGSSFSYSAGAGGCGGGNGSDGDDGDDGNFGGTSTFSGTDAGGLLVNLAANGGSRGTGGDGTEGSTGSGGSGGGVSGGTTNTPGGAGNNGSGGNGGTGGANAGPAGGAGGASTGAGGNQYGGGGAGGGNSSGGPGARGGILISFNATTTIPVPTISSTLPTCTIDGSSTISNYDGAMTYLFTPSGPSAGAGGAITGMVTGTSYTVIARDAGGCDSQPSAPFSNAPAAPLPIPAISTAPPTCTTDGISTITNYNGAMTYLFTPSGPSAGAGGVITGMIAGTSYTTEATDGSCTSAPSASFSNSAQLPAPVALITGSLSYCTGSNTTLSASGGVSYVWTDAGAINIGNSADVPVTQGVYTVVVTDANNCTASASATVTETAGPSATLMAAPMQICTGQSVTFTADLSGFSLYEFFLNGTSVQSSAANTYTSSAIAQGDIVTVRAQDAGCFGPISSDVSVTVLQIGTATVTLSVAPASICLGQNVTFTASPSGFLLYEFLVNGTVVQTDVSNTYSTTAIVQGDVVTARASDILCFGPESNPVSLTILQIGTAVVSLSASEDTICLGQDVTFTATPPGFALYEFIRNGSAVQLSASNTYTTSTLLQIDTLIVRASDQGCFGPISNEVHVFIQSTLPVNAGNDIVTCPHAPPITLQGFSPAGGTWSGLGITNPSGIFNPSSVSSGTHTLTYSVSDANGCSGDDAISAEVYAPVQADFSATPVVMELADSIPVVFTDLSSGAVSWQWNFGDENSSNLQNPTHVYSDTGSYTITLITTDANGCTDTTVRINYILVAGAATVFVPNAFTPNTDGVNDVLFVYGEGISEIVFEVYNRWGELVFVSRNMSDGWDGTYLGKLMNPDVYIYTLYVEFTNRKAERHKGSVTLLR